MATAQMVRARTAPAQGANRPAQGTVKPAQGPARPAQGDSAPATSSKLDEMPILFQKYFKTEGQRTFAAQVRETRKGDHCLVITQGRRDEVTGEVRKTRILVWSEDFPAFFRMMQETAVFIRANPVSEEVRQRRQRYLAKRAVAASEAVAEA